MSLGLSIGAAPGPALLAAAVLVLPLLHQRLRRGDRFARSLAVVAAFALWALLTDLRLPLGRDLPRLATPGAPATTPATFRWGLEGDAVRSLLALPADVAGVAVSGFGLPGVAWDEARVQPVTFDPPALPSGFRSLAWPEEVTVGEPIDVRGQLVADEVGRGHTVSLAQAGVTLARATIAADGAFALRVPARVPGRSSFDLQVDGEDLTERLAVRVDRPAPLAVRIALAAPSFDARAARDWLRESGNVSGVVTVRLAPGIERRETFGADVVPAGTSAAAAAPTPAPPDGTEREGPWDLAIVDGQTLAEEPERWLAPTRASAGLLVLHRGAALRPELGFSLAADAPAAETTATIGATALAVRRSGALAPAAGHEVLLRDGEGRVLAAIAPLGAGRIAVTTLEGTAGWVTSGDESAHGRWWSELVERLARPVGAGLLAEHSELVATVGLRSILCRAAEGLPSITPAPVRPLLPIVVTPGWRCDGWWPDRVGWHEVDDRALHVYAPDALAAARAEARRAATQVRLAAPASFAPGRGMPLQTAWWLLFAAAAVGAWWRERAY